MPTDDNPLFDDEYLPDWLQNAGVNKSDQQQSSASKPAEQAGADDNMPWLKKNASADSGSSGEASFDDDISIPWQVDSAPTPGQKPGGAGAGFGLTGALPWRQGASDPADKPGDPFAALDSPPPKADDMDWLNAPAGQPASSADPRASSPNLMGLDQAAPGSAAPSPTDDLDWLNSPSDSDNADDIPMSFMPAAPLAPEAAPPPPPAPVKAPPPPASPSASGLMGRLGKVGPAAPPPPAKAPPPAPAAPVDLPPLNDDDIPDWFKDAEPVAQQPVAQQPAAPAEDQTVPDWLSAASPTDAAGSDTGVSDLLDWMSQQPEAAGATTAPPASQPANQASESLSNFDWLSASDADAAPVSDDDIPAWMREAAPADSVPTSAAAPAPADDMDWLNNFANDSSGSLEGWPATGTAAPTGSAPAVPSAPREERIDIDALLSLAPSTPTVFDESAAPSAGPMVVVNKDDQALTTTGGDISLDDLFQSDETAAADDAAAASLAAFDLPTPETTAEGLPDLPPLELTPQAPVRRLPQQSSGNVPLSSQAAAEVEAQAAAIPAAPPPNKPQEELPDWVSEMRPAEAPIALKIGDQEVHIVEKPNVQLNDDLRRIRDRSRALQEQNKQQEAAYKSPTDEALAQGPLAGITGAIEAIPSIVQPGTTSASTQVVATDAQMRRARLIQKILESEDLLLQQRAKSEDALEEQAAVAVAPSTRARIKVDRLLITLLLTVVIVAPFFIKNLGFIPVPDTSQLTPLQAAVASKVDALQPGQPVLVAFEYGPTGSGELDELAKVALQDIIRHKAHPILVSTNPAGAMHAETLMTGLAALSNPPLVARQDYVVLRYLPGGSAGVRAAVNAIFNGGLQQQIVFATDIEGKPSNLSPETIDALKNNPAFILTESQEDVRNWAEQYQSDDENQPLPMIFLSSVGASAVADTYSHTASQRIFGPLVGLRDAMIYGTVRQIATTSSADAAKAQQTANERWQSIGLGTLTAAVLILIGAAINLIRSLPRRRRR